MTPRGELTGAGRHRLVDEVERLNEEVRALALNLAVCLARVRAEAESEDLKRLEPKFIRLINGTVKMAQELAGVLNTSRHRDQIDLDMPDEKRRHERIETGLRAIEEQCRHILGALPSPGGSAT
jgi:hypothetical protein